MEEKVKHFKARIDIEYEAAKKYGEPEEVGVWELVMNIYENIFGK